jgi:hypothetical protein
MPAELYTASAAEYELEPGIVHIGYFGVFYATRGLTEVVAALRALPAEDRARIRFHVFTVKPDALTQEAEEAGISDVLVARPYVSYLEFLNLTTRFDALLVNDARTIGIHEINPYLPSKYADYAGSGREIWGIVEPGSVLSTCRLDHRSDLGDVDGAVAVLQQLAARGPARTAPDVTARSRVDARTEPAGSRP